MCTYVENYFLPLNGKQIGNWAFQGLNWHCEHAGFALHWSLLVKAYGTAFGRYVVMMVSLWCQIRINAYMTIWKLCVALNSLAFFRDSDERIALWFQSTVKTTKWQSVHFNWCFPCWKASLWCLFLTFHKASVSKAMTPPDHLIYHLTLKRINGATRK